MKVSRLFLPAGFRVGLACALFFLSVAAFRFPLLEQFDLRLLDAKFRLRGAEKASEEIAIVEIDKASIHKVGKWPWPRRIIADIIEIVSVGRPKAIGSDILFAQPDADPGNDEALIDTLKRAGNVVLPFYFILSEEKAAFQSAEELRKQLRNVSGSAVGIISNLRGTERAPHSPRAWGLESSTAPISHAAAGAGYYNVQLGPDGVVRRIPLTISAEGRSYLPLSVAVLREALRCGPAILFLDGEKILSLNMGGHRIPVSGDGTILINYCGGRESFRTYPAAQLLEGAFPPESFTDAIVLIGGTSIGDFEMRLTPFSMNTPSVVIQANAIDNYLRGRVLTKPYYSPLLMAIGIAGLSLLPGIVISRIPRIAYGALFALAAGLCWLSLDFYLFSVHHVQVKTVYPLLSLMGSYTAVTLLSGASQERSKRRLVRGIQAIGESLGTRTDSDGLCDNVIGPLLDFLGARRGFILLRTGSEGGGDWGAWNLKAVRGMGYELPGSSAFTPYTKVVSAVEKSAEPLLVPRTAWKKLGVSQGRHRPDFLICLPLSAGGRLTGIAYADGERAAPYITAEGLPLVSSVARQLGTAIENASLYSEAREVKERALGRDLFIGGPITPKRRFDQIIGSSAAMRRVFDLVERAATSNSTVVIEGETGTGKELIARAIHSSGSREHKIFIALNCASLPEALLESELFGHVRGSFTGALTDKKGLFASAHGGTVFLDEITECSPALQAKLLRVLQNGVIRPVGGTRETRVDVRVISATNRNIEDEVKKGRFRKDLYYRLNVFPIKIPPLRERREDIPQIALHFLRRDAEKARKSIDGFSNEAMRLLTEYDFQGNVRELENEVERVVAMHMKGRTITAENLSEKFRAGAKGVLGWNYALGEKPLKESLKELERGIILEALGSCDWNVTRAARKLGMSRYGLYKKMMQHGISSSPE